MKRKIQHIFGAIAIAAAALSACTEHVDTSARYVFKEETIASYLAKNAQYSEFVKLMNMVPVSEMSESTVGQLLAARGNYTCFAPTNEAIDKYLQKLTEEGLISAPNWESFPSQHKLDSIRAVVVLNSVIDGGDVTQYSTWDFPTETNGEFPLSNMNDRRLTVRYVNDPDSIYLNYDCPVSVRNR
ncbi:MAG: fasciclin domain-containing protein, partial [Bacteroidaceae bacterium]|nr:fasciclin domain-containing protein [Bacteroidaceae bacterium]